MRTATAARPTPIPGLILRMTSEGDRRAVHAEYRAEARPDLPKGHVRPHGLEEPRDEVPGPARRRLDGVERPRRPVLVPAPPEVAQPLGLASLDAGVGLEEGGRRGRVGHELVDADNEAVAALHLLLVAVRRVLDLLLHERDRRDRAAQPVDLV